MTHSITLVILYTTVVSKHIMQLWREAILTAFQCRAVDLEMNSCKRHKTHYTWKKGPLSFHDKVAAIECDHNHKANIEGEHDIL
jgi:hypothetical protein